MSYSKTVLAYSFTALAILCYIPILIPAFLLSFLGLGKPMSWLVYKCAQAWAKTIIFITGCPMTVEGREHIPAKSGICFVSNHVGMFDIVLTLANIGQPFGFIAKKELAFLPFFNIWIYMLGGLYIDRKSVRKAIKTINKGINKIQHGRNMLIFPEGTRNKGLGLLPFRSGAIKLATHSLAPIIPIAITGSYEVYEKHNRLRAVPVRMVFCPPVYTAELDSGDRKQLTEQIYSIIEAALKKD